MCQPDVSLPLAWLFWRRNAGLGTLRREVALVQMRASALRDGALFLLGRTSLPMPANQVSRSGRQSSPLEDGHDTLDALTPAATQVSLKAAAHAVRLRTLLIILKGQGAVWTADLGVFLRPYRSYSSVVRRPSEHAFIWTCATILRLKLRREAT
jgi:hypothetical protein